MDRIDKDPISSFRMVLVIFPHVFHKPHLCLVGARFHAAAPEESNIPLQDFSISRELAPWQQGASDRIMSDHARRFAGSRYLERIFVVEMIHEIINSKRSHS